jgi:hypothetical protein
MKVRCTNPNGCGKALINGNEYEVLGENGEYYEILREDRDEMRVGMKTGWYLKSRFTPIKEDKVMKIKEWKELNGYRLSNGYIIDSQPSDLYLTLTHDSLLNLCFSYQGIGTENIIKILEVMGLKVEFEKEPTITQEEHDLLKWLGNYEDLFLHKWRDGEEIACGTFKAQKSYGIHFTKCLFNWFEPNKQYAVSDLLKMKVEG